MSQFDLPEEDASGIIIEADHVLSLEEVLDPERMSVPLYNSKYVFRAWNEALADFFGYVHSRNEFFSDEVEI